MEPYSGHHESGVDPSTLTGKVMCGYQGWFAAEGDGSGRGWFHYAPGHNAPEPGNCTFDLWPDMSEMDADEKFPTAFTYEDGSTAHLFSPYKKKTVVRHFQWMKEYGIDGIFLQRFGSSLRSTISYNHRNVVTANVQAGANQHGRTWAMMYDLSGLKPGEIESLVIPDWKKLVEQMEITQDKSYLHHEGKPVVAVWGIGFNDGREYSLEECETLVRFFKEVGTTVMLGVPTAWRTLQRDAVADRKLHEIIALADIVSPWTVGRYDSPAGAKKHAKEIAKPDIAWANQRGLDYLPVAFPGFSWRNLQQTHGKDYRTRSDPPPRAVNFCGRRAVPSKTLVQKCCISQCSMRSMKEPRSSNAPTTRQSARVRFSPSVMCRVTTICGSPAK